MQLLASTFLLLVPFVLAQGPPTSPCTISNPATGLFIDLENPSAEFDDAVVGRDATGQPSQVWRLSGPPGSNLINTKPSLTPLGVTSSGQLGEALRVFFKVWVPVSATAVGPPGLFKLAINNSFVTAGDPDAPLTLESPAAGTQLQEWLFEEVDADAL